MAKAKKAGAGELTEQLTILSPAPVARVITSITRSAAVATVTTAIAHELTDQDFVTISGATSAAYNGEVQATVTGATTFTFTVAGSPDSPATVPGAVIFTSDAQGGSPASWYTFASGVWAEVLPLSASEQLAAGGIAAVITYKARVRYRADLKPTMRVSWLRYQETVSRELEIYGIHDDPDNLRAMMFLDLGEVAA